MDVSCHIYKPIQTMVGKLRTETRTAKYAILPNQHNSKPKKFMQTYESP